MRQRGRFIVIDGPDGCGKSTQVRLLACFLRRAGRAVRTVRDPGTTALGRMLRRALLSRRAPPPPPPPPPSAIAELFAYLAARAQLVEEVIRPALARGVWVLSDRYSASTIAYQGYGPGRPRAQIDRIGELCRIAEGGIEPDLTVLLDLPAEAGMGRIRRRRDRIEARPLSFHRRVRSGFLEQARGDGRFAVLDARKPPGVLSLRVQALAAPLLPR